MYGIGTDMAIKDWFDFSVPAISVKRNYVKRAIAENIKHLQCTIGIG